MLTKAQVAQFHEQGFLVVEKVFTSAQTESVREAALQIVDEFDIERHRTVFSTKHGQDAGRDDYFFESAEAVHCFLEEDALTETGELTCDKALAINKIGHAMHDLVPAFTDFCRLPPIGQALRDIGYQAPELWQSMYIFKQPRIGGEVRWHQDASYLITEPSRVTGLWVALEDATTDNGCMWMQPGQHHSPLREIFEVDWQRRGGELRALDDTPWVGAAEPVALECPAGSMVLFNDHMPHYSSQNTSRQSRHAFTIHVSDASARWLEKNWLQRKTLAPFAL